MSGPNKDQAPAEKVLANCGKCGLCLSVCPVYKTLKEEQASPRARLQLIKAFENNQLDTSPLLKELISKCLMCGSCAAACPSGIDHYGKFMEMRQKMVDALGDKPAINALVYLLAKEYRLRTGSKMAALGQKLTPDFIADKYKVGNIPVSRFPALNPRPFRQKQPTRIQPDADALSGSGMPRGRIAYFTGCATNYMFADTGNAVTGILTALGYEVVIPETQTCCAIPMLFHGAAQKAENNIRTNITALAEVNADRIIVDCTTCGAALKDEYPVFIGRSGVTDDLKEAAADIARKTTDILSFIGEHEFNFHPDASRESRHLGRAVYHAPCHSRNSFASHAGIQTLLKHLPNLDYVPTPGEADCCGGGGTFFYEHPETAARIMDRKQDQLRTVEPSLWLTDCPVCRINLAGNLESDSLVEVCHPVVPIHAAMNEV